MYFGYDLSIEEYAKDFEKLGCTHEEAVEIAKAAVQGAQYSQHGDMYAINNDGTLGKRIGTCSMLKCRINNMDQ